MRKLLLVVALAGCGSSDAAPKSKAKVELSSVNLAADCPAPKPAAKPAKVPANAPASPAVVAQLRKVLALDPNDPTALFHLGRAAAAAGDKAGAVQQWRRLLARLPHDSPEHATIEDLLRDLGADG